MDISRTIINNFIVGNPCGKFYVHEEASNLIEAINTVLQDLDFKYLLLVFGIDLKLMF